MAERVIYINIEMYSEVKNWQNKIFFSVYSAPDG